MKSLVYIFCICLLNGATLSAQSIKKIKITELETIISSSTKPMIINFWATWCQPCLEEIPYFQRIAARYREDSVELLLVSLDVEKEYPKGIKELAKKREITAQILWLNETDADYFCPRVDNKWSGAIPATLFVDTKRGYRKFQEEQLSEETLEAEIRSMLGR